MSLNLKPKKLTQIIDPNLKFIKYLPKTDSCIVTKKDSGAPAVLRIGPDIGSRHPSGKDWKHNCVQNEARALTELQGVAGIPRLYSEYNRAVSKKVRCYAILKEFIRGKPTQWKQNYPKTFKEDLEKLIVTLCQKGVMVLGEHKSISDKLIITKKGKPYFRNLGSAQIIPLKEGQHYLNDVNLAIQYEIFRTLYFDDIK